MSEGTQNIVDEQAVVGEPASHPHHTVVVGEPPEDVTPVLGEPAFANGVQDQQLVLPPSAEVTSANGVQSSLPEEGLSPSVPPSDVSAPSSAAPVEESPNVQHVPSAEVGDSGLGEDGAHHSEPHVTGNAGPATTNTNTNTICSTEEEPAADIPDTVEVTHIVDGPSEASPSLHEVPTENPFVALDEDSTTAPKETLTGDTSFTDGASTANASSTTDETSLKGIGDEQEEASLSSAVRGKQSVKVSTSDTDDGPLEGNKDVKGGIGTAELKQVSQGDAPTQDSDVKDADLKKEETGSTVVECAGAAELDRESKREALVPGNYASEDIPEESEITTRDVGQSLSKEAATPSQASSAEILTCNQGIGNVNHTGPITSEWQSNEETPVEGSSAGSSFTPKDTRDLAVEEYSSSAVEASLPPAANGDNDYQHGEDVTVEREQDLPKVDDDASEEVEKPTSRSKLPLIFTGLAIAAVGVAVASISRPH